MKFIENQFLMPGKEKTFKEITAAYEILKDPQKRKQYFLKIKELLKS